MKMKEILGVYFAKWIDLNTKKWIHNPLQIQSKTLNNLIREGSNTAFGREHKFNEIVDYETFKLNVPIRDYEAYQIYIDRMIHGEANVTWKDRPIYFCKSSGTTSGVKYLPISKDSMKNHIQSARNALLNYIHTTGNSDIINGKMIFLQGSPELKMVNEIPTGRLSGIVAHHVPKYLHKNRLPSYATNCIKDWEEKVDRIVDETIIEDMTVISGIPPWLQMYFEKVIQKTGKSSLKELFPNLKLIIVGGVNFEPYNRKFRELLGPGIDIIEIYPASEGFFAYQDNLLKKDLLLLLNENIFYEFIPVDNVFTSNPERIMIKDVELNKNYALVLSSNAGFWGYLIGDVIKFTSIKPYKIIVTGRIKHFISAFGEHVIAEEVENAVSAISKKFQIVIKEFTVAPKINTESDELPYHEWFIEFESPLENIQEISIELDTLIRSQNIYYNDLIAGNILQALKIRPIRSGGFADLMKIQGKYGGQNKVVHLCNDRTLASLIESNNLVSTHN